MIDTYPAYQRSLFLAEAIILSTWSGLLAEPADADQGH